MSADPLASNLTAHVTAINLCLAKHLRTPGLVLIYCGIDIMGNLNRPPFNAGSTRTDFINWSEIYMSCNARLGVSGLDLYAARCGLLHTYTMDSILSDIGKARRILYAWGNKDVAEPNKLMASIGNSEIFVKIEDLRDTFVDSIAAFNKVVNNDPGFAALTRARARKFFMNQATFP